jgi:hypothetical protein
MIQNFVTTFLFESEFPSVDQALQIVRQKVFKEASSLPLEQEEDEWTAPFQKLQGCYNINADEDDDPRKVNITETEGHRDVEGPGVELPFIGQPIKIKKVNIGTEETPKLANVGDYWDAATIDKITELLHEYQDLFPLTKFTDMKGIKGMMLVYMILSLHHSQMKCWIMWEAKKYILLQMGFQDTIRSALPRRTIIRPHFPQNGDPTNIQ